MLYYFQRQKNRIEKNSLLKIQSGHKILLHLAYILLINYKQDKSVYIIGMKYLLWGMENVA